MLPSAIGPSGGLSLVGARMNVFVLFDILRDFNGMLHQDDGRLAHPFVEVLL